MIARPRATRRYEIAAFSMSGLFVIVLVFSLLFVRVAGAVQATGEVTLGAGLVDVVTGSGGVVSTVFVANGDEVVAGQELVQLADSGLTQRISNTVQRGLNLEARVARLEALQGGLAELGAPPAGVPADIWEGEQALLDAQFASLALGKERLQQEADARLAERDAATTALSLVVSLHKSAVNEADTARAAGDANAQDLENRSLELAIDLARAKSAVATADAALDAARTSVDNIDVQGALETARDLEGARFELDQVHAEQASLELEESQLAVVATCDGTVVNLLPLAGSFAQVGVPLMQLIPAAEVSQARLAVAATDIDNVSKGQRVKLDVQSYAGSDASEIWGHVVVVAAAPTRTAAGLTYFEVIVELETRPDQPLTVGMPVAAQLRTGERSLLDYLFSPIKRRFGGALTES